MTPERFKKFFKRKDRPFEGAQHNIEANQPVAEAKGDGTGPTVQVVEIRDTYDSTRLRETLLETSRL